ncbi:unnamed protein product [Hymenolepis diminuta]|uniref:Peptidase A2 domain-containing protein n=1 Tax=Hymenolepis diminuta TaxID=6216 RepID=A0A564YL87_HYMDI|nr:unnamed protein product [Hymenolepis diminuta]
MAHSRLVFDFEEVNKTKQVGSQHGHLPLTSDSLTPAGDLNTYSSNLNDGRANSLKFCKTFAAKYMNERLSELLRGDETPSEILAVMSFVSMKVHLQEEIFKELFFQKLRPDVQMYLRDKMPFYSTHQLAHMADILLNITGETSSNLLFIVDSNSGMNFVIDTGSKNSFITPTPDERNKLIPINWIKAPKGKDIAVYGYANLTVDIGLGRLFTWNFTIADIIFPIIGADFLVNFDILIDVKRQVLIANSYPPIPHGALSSHEGLVECKQQKTCKYLLSYLKSSIVFQRMQSCVSLNDNFWKRLLLFFLPQSYRRTLKNILSSAFTIYEPALEADKFHQSLNKNNSPCLSLRDRKSELCFLIDSGASRSQIPPLPNEKFSIIPYSRLRTANGTPVLEYSYKNLNVDFGLGEIFTWNFIITDTVIPIIGADFLSHFSLIVDLKGRKLLRGQQTPFHQSCAPGIETST